MPTWTSEQLLEYETRRSLSNTKQRECPQALAGSDAGEAQGTGCVPVCFTLYRIRLLDVDAKYSSVKDLLDCLVASGLVDGDKEGQITLEVHQQKVSTRKEERTEIEVELTGIYG